MAGRAPDGAVEVSALYSARTTGGALILVSSTGVRSGPPDVLDALLRGEPVDPRGYYFRTLIRIETSEPALAALQDVLFIAAAVRDSRSGHVHGLSRHLIPRARPLRSRERRRWPGGGLICEKSYPRPLSYARHRERASVPRKRGQPAVTVRVAVSTPSALTVTVIVPAPVGRTTARARPS